MRKTKTIKSILVNYVTTVINTDMETMDASVFVKGKGNILISEMKIKQKLHIS